MDFAMGATVAWQALKSESHEGVTPDSHERNDLTSLPDQSLVGSVRQKLCTLMFAITLGGLGTE